MNDQIEELKTNEQQAGANALDDKPQVITGGGSPKFRGRTRRQRPSLFGPVLLIGVGVYFLMTNMGIIDGSLHWEVLLRLWPVFLIFIGFNIIARQLPGALGSFASGLVGLSFVVLIGTILLFADRLPFINAYVSTAGKIKRVDITQPLGEARSAVVTIDANSLPLSVDDLQDSNQLIRGRISYVGDLIEDYQLSSDNIRYSLNTRAVTPFSSASFSNEDRWDLSLTPSIPLDLNFDLASGTSDLNLSRLEIKDLEIDAGSGSSAIRLPDGDYKVFIDMGSGASRVTLPRTGAIGLTIDGGSGAMNFTLPGGMPMRIQLEDGSGSFRADERFELISGDPVGSGVWETRSYNPEANDRIELTLDLGSGSFVIGGE